LQIGLKGNNIAKTGILFPGINRDIQQQLDQYIDLIADFGYRDQPLLLLSRLINLLEQFDSLAAARNVNSIRCQRMHLVASKLETDLQKRLSLTEIAHEFGISVEHLRKDFSREFNISPKRYRIKHRIHRAQLLLCDKSVAIEEIAHELGYSDQFTFSRQFKQKTGVAPTIFRSQLQH
jgi:AraC-like DNA-binding protein